MVNGWRFEALMIFVAVVMMGQLLDNYRPACDENEPVEIPVYPLTA